MATKTGLLNAINGFLTVLVTILKVKQSTSAIIDELYPDAITESSAADGNFHREYANVDYDITSWKQGRTVTAIVDFRNDGTTANNVVLATFVNNEMIPNGIYQFHIQTVTGAIARIQVSSAGIRLMNSMITQSTVPFRGILTWPVNA